MPCAKGPRHTDIRTENSSTVVHYVRRGHSQPGVISINYTGNIWAHTRYKCLGFTCQQFTRLSFVFVL